MNNERLCDHTLFMRSILVFGKKKPHHVHNECATSSRTAVEQGTSTQQPEDPPR